MNSGPLSLRNDRSAPLSDQCFQVVEEVVGGDGPFDQSADAFAGVFIHDRADLEHIALLTDIELEIHGPHHIGCIRSRSVDCGGDHTFASAALWHSETFFTLQEVNYIMVDEPFFNPCIMVTNENSPT